MTNHKDYYAVLDINPHADQRAIAEAYERLSRQYQPDENAPATDPQRMREIDEAFDVLDDPARRAEYDRLRASPVTGQPAMAAVGAGWAPGAEPVPTEGAGAASRVPRPSATWIGPALMGFGALVFILGGLALLYAALSGGGEETVVLASGVKYVDTETGTGEPPRAGDALEVHYTGKLEDGTVFDSSLDRNPFVFVLGAEEVIPGWDEGFASMREGGKRTLIIPPELAYGDRGIGPIPPNATLTFDVELRDIQRIGQGVTAASGLQYIDLEPGRTQRSEAIAPAAGDRVIVHYQAFFEDGTKFADTGTAGQPYAFVLGSGSEIDGFEEGVSTMRVCGLRRLTVPPDLGYGDEVAEFTVGDQLVTVPPNSTLLFEIKLVGIGEEPVACA
jgi:peptidylprolyl isomerase